MSNYYVLMLPFPPSVNNMHRTGGKSKVRYKSKTYQNWLKEADAHAMQQKPFKYFNKRVDVTVHLGGGANNYDCDNFHKIPSDYIVNLGIIKDDSKPYVRSTRQIWNDDIKGAMVVIEECEI